MAGIRLIVADDHSIVLDGLRRLFESEGDFEVVATCADGIAALDAVRSKPCDVLVLDLKMPGKTGLEVLQAMSQERLSCRTVLLTAALKDDDVVQALKLGATGVVLKESEPSALLECVRRVHQGEQWIDRETLSRAFGRVMMRESATREASRNLTPRELEIVRMIAQGLRNKVVAERLSISEGTVKIHLHNIYEKLGVDGRLELVLFAQEKGLT
ncbi:MAG TPA: response regulator transcription factor [Vicinamibacterales bacterium]|nr:response regulator transcription factor [Vicinamibacterales bacterium]